LAIVFKKQEISQQVVARMQDLASKFSQIFRGDIPGPLASVGIKKPWFPLNFSAMVAPLIIIIIIISRTT